MMKKIFPVFAAMAVVIVSCKKHVTSGCLQAKIIRVTCASTVMQVLSDNSLGEDSWTDIFNNNARYDNVFAVSNRCHIPSEYKVGDVVYIAIQKAAAGDCVACAMYDAPPGVSYDVRSIGSLPCDDGVLK